MASIPAQEFSVAAESEYFVPTHGLRWIVRPLREQPTHGTERVLQQAYQGDRGSIEWHDVPEAGQSTP